MHDEYTILFRNNALYLINEYLNIDEITRDMLIRLEFCYSFDKFYFGISKMLLTYLMLILSTYFTYYLYVYSVHCELGRILNFSVPLPELFTYIHHMYENSHKC